jgi:hypothetical protein
MRSSVRASYSRLLLAFVTLTGSTLLMPPVTTSGQSNIHWDDPFQRLAGNTGVREEGDGVRVVTNVTGSQIGQPGGGGGPATDASAGQPAGGTGGGRLTAGPCVFVAESSNPSWWQTLVGEIDYYVAPCAPLGDEPAVPFARDLAQHVPLPRLDIRISPDPGLVAVPTRYWIDSYQGQPLGDSDSLVLPPLVGSEVPLWQYPADCPCRQPRVLVVDVQVWPVGYRWTFGDGRPDGRSPGPVFATASLGRPAPQGDPRRALVAGEIAHTYEFASFYTGGGFPVGVEATFVAAFRVNGGEWRQLDLTLAQSGTTRHRVQEIQVLLDGGTADPSRRPVGR